MATYIYVTDNGGGVRGLLNSAVQANRADLQLRVDLLNGSTDPGFIEAFAEATGLTYSQAAAVLSNDPARADLALAQALVQDKPTDQFNLYAPDELSAQRRQGFAPFILFSNFSQSVTGWNYNFWPDFYLTLDSETGLPFASLLYNSYMAPRAYLVFLNTSPSRNLDVVVKRKIHPVWSVEQTIYATDLPNVEYSSGQVNPPTYWPHLFFSVPDATTNWTVNAITGWVRSGRIYKGPSFQIGNSLESFTSRLVEDLYWIDPYDSSYLFQQPYLLDSVNLDLPSVIDADTVIRRDGFCFTVPSFINTSPGAPPQEWTEITTDGEVVTCRWENGIANPI